MPSTYIEPRRHAQAGNPGEAERVRTRAQQTVESVAQTAGNTGEGVLQVLHGAERIGSAAYKLQRNAMHRVRGVVKPPYAATEVLDNLEAHKLGEGVGYQVLYDRSALSRPPQLDLTARMLELGEQARVVHLAPTKLLLVDDEIALLPLTTSTRTVESAVLVRNSAMLAAVTRIFDDLWKFAAPLRMSGELEAESGQPSDEERWILSLLASGATDEAIGRLMGFSSRTAHRRVRELIARLGVETRFQAGVQAVKLGWL